MIARPVHKVCLQCYGCHRSDDKLLSDKGAVICIAGTRD